MSDAKLQSEDICPYRSTCVPCEGPRALYRVLFNSGDSVEMRNVENVQLTETALIVTPAVGPKKTFLRKDLFSAGCGLVGVPPVV